MNSSQLVLKIHKKRNKIEGHPIAYSRISNVEIPKCVHQSDTQSVKVCLGHNPSNMNVRQLCMKILIKRDKIKGRPINNRYIWDVIASE